jgi:hypothetical protein
MFFHVFAPYQIFSLVVTAIPQSIVLKHYAREFLQLTAVKSKQRLKEIEE